MKPDHYDTWSHANSKLPQEPDSDVSEDDTQKPVEDMWEALATPLPTEAAQDSPAVLNEPCLNPSVLCTPPSRKPVPVSLDNTPQRFKTADSSTLVTPPRKVLPGVFALRTPQSRSVSTSPHQMPALTHPEPPVSPSPRRRAGIWRLGKDKARNS